ncbi:MAG: hypothetical protein QOI76_1118 [Frankiales bacterium]|jgi:alpha-tubulin suppressor-like RCC1 family protein|nr:hypothetical protein [Frankiales bacterium]
MRKGLRWATALVLAASSLGVVAPDVARAATHLSVHVSPATAYVGSVVVVSGTANARATVEVDRLVGKVWQPLAHAKALTSGAFSVPVKVPGRAGRLTLRAVSGTALSGKLVVRVTKAIYKVSIKPAGAIVNNGSPIVVTGTVSAKGKGVVWLQRLVAGKWHNVSQVKLTSHATYRLTSAQAPGSYRLRVYKPYTRTVAGGVSPAMTVVVLPSPVVVTTSLPAGTVGHAYTATLAATSGLPPYTWSVTSGQLPAGLTLSAAGALAGLPTVAGTSNVTFLATDSHGQGISQVIAIMIAPAYGPLWAWGFGGVGDLGNGATVDSTNIVPVTGLTNAIAVTAGANAAYAVLSDHTLWDWGYDGDGEHGDGLTVSTDLPHQVPGLTQVVSVAGGYYNGYAARSDGTVWGWGDNFFGQVGDGTNTSRLSPVRVSGLTGVTAVAATGFSAYALRSDGTVWAWGAGTNGQLGNGGTVDSKVPVQVGAVSGATGIAAGFLVGYALLDTGQVMAWGSNSNGELGNNGAATYSTTAVAVSGLTHIIGVASGWNNGYASRADGSVWAWGAGSAGQLGNGSTALSKVPVQVTGLSTAVSVGAGAVDGYAVLADGTVRAWGDNAHGQLGNGTTTASSLPVQVSGLTGVTEVAGGLYWAMALQTG